MSELTMTVSTSINLKELYEIDDHLWLEKTIDLLKENKWNELDLENLIEELESLAKRDKLAMASLLEQVIRHLLLLQFWTSQSEYNSAHWQAEITAFRTQLRRNLTTNLNNYLQDELITIYQDALKYAKRKSKLTNLPSKSPYTLEQLLDEDWFPHN